MCHAKIRLGSTEQSFWWTFICKEYGRKDCLYFLVQDGSKSVSPLAHNFSRTLIQNKPYLLQLLHELLTWRYFSALVKLQKRLEDRARTENENHQPCCTRNRRKETRRGACPKANEFPLIAEQRGRKSGGSHSTFSPSKFIYCSCSMEMARFRWVGLEA